MKLLPLCTFPNVSKYIFLSILMIFVSQKVIAQDSESIELSKINLYIDFGGGFTSGLASLNFEGRIHSGNKVTWYARGGIGGGGEEDADGPGVLGAITMITGKGSNHFEMNAGAFIGRYSDVKDESFTLPILDLGYRYQDPAGGVLLRAKVGYLGIGFGVGYAF